MIELETIPVPAFAIRASSDGSFRYIGINDVNHALTGFSAELIVGKSPQDLFPAEVAERLCAHYRSCIDQRRLIDYDVSAMFPAGLSWWRATLLPIIGPSGEVDTIIGTCSDVHCERRTGLDLQAANRHLDLAIRCLKGADWRLDVETGLYSVSDNLAVLLGEAAPRPVAWGEWVERILPEDLGGTTCDPLLAGATRDQVVRFRFRNVHDEVRWAQCRRIVSIDDQPNRVVCGVIVDVTDERHRELRLEDEAQRDSLTGLLNRRGFTKSLDRALSQTRGAQETSLAIVMIDLDGFKQINDRHGHAVGDEVLIEVARRLATSVGERMLCGRLGGDEFVVACLDVERREAVGLAQQLEDALCRPLLREGEWIGMGASVGASWRQHPVDVNAMTAEADAKLYYRKRVRKVSVSCDAESIEAELLSSQMNLFAA